MIPAQPVGLPAGLPAGSAPGPSPETPAFAPVSAATWLGRALLAAVFLGGLALAQSALPHFANTYVETVLVNAGINVILAVSLNLINGITGQFSLGHAGFMAVGAYAAAAFTRYAGPRLVFPDQVTFAMAIVLAAVAAGLAGWLVGLPSLRLRGDYLAIVTLGFNQIIIALIYTMPVLGAQTGMTGLKHDTTFVWVFGLMTACILCVRNLADSHWGRSMRAVRDDEVAAEAAGINTTRTKVVAFVVSSMWAGVAGALQVHSVQQSVNPDMFTFQKSIEIVVTVVLGGLGSITGCALAGFSLKALEDVLRSLAGAGAMIVLLVAFAAAQTWPRARRLAAREGSLAWARWAAGPVLALVALGATLHFAAAWLNQYKDALRYLVYALILIVMQLLRPQGLLGRNEWSFRRWRRSPSAHLSPAHRPNPSSP